MSKYVYLKMADGSILDGTAGYATGQLWLYFQRYRELTIADVCAIMCNPEKTGEITFVCNKEWRIYRGFTLQAVIQDDEEIKVRLSGGTVSEWKAEEWHEGTVGGNGPDLVSDGDGGASGDVHPE